MGRGTRQRREIDVQSEVEGDEEAVKVNGEVELSKEEVREWEGRKAAGEG